MGYTLEEFAVLDTAEKILDLIRYSKNIGDDVDSLEFRDKIINIILGRGDHEGN
jgi:hypothetical protein